MNAVPQSRRARRSCSGPNRSCTTGGFTLLEVMIAGGILFMCLFAILGLLANTLRNARALQRNSVDAGLLAAQLSLTNRLSEGSDNGDFSDFGDSYRDYQWKNQITEITNGLFQVDFAVSARSGAHGGESHMSILLFRPESVRSRP